jgi:alanyl-tRNA synthetase
MGGHHAFNHPGRMVYWMDGTVELHHAFLTECIGVKPELVSYKEGFWSGGGNAGPDLEACVEGLEVSTLVFMQYKMVDGSLERIPILTVDTGYGIERWSWLSQGSPSGFHAIYGGLLEKIFSISGISADEEIISEYAKLSGILDSGSEEDRKGAESELERRTGLRYEELSSLLSPVQWAFAIADHTKSLAFLLAEGVVPSNVGAGYLSRYLIRRAIRLLMKLGIEAKLLEIVGAQIAHWSRDFPALREMEPEIAEIIGIEEERYRNTLGKARGLIREAIRSGRLRAGEAPEGVLREFYQSHGIFPDLLVEFASAEGAEVEIPKGFASKLVDERSKPPPPSEPELDPELVKWASAHPETRALYYEDPRLREFEAAVLGTIGDEYVVLDATGFYPEGGGQLSDIGLLHFDGGPSRIVDVRKVGKVVIHRIEGSCPKPGQKVRGELDWERRSSLMRHHSAAHLLLGALRRVLGRHVWQAGAQKGPERSHLDFTHYKRLSAEELWEVESLVYEKVLEDVPIKVGWMPREEAEAKYGFTLYQGGAVPGRNIRVVEIEGWDAEACGGIHCSRTGEMGIVKILKAERIQDGVERITFASGKPALAELRRGELRLREVERRLGASGDELVKAVGDLSERARALRKEAEGLRRKLGRCLGEAILGEVWKVGRLKLWVGEGALEEKEESIYALEYASEKEPSAVLVRLLKGDPPQILVSAGKEAIRRGVHAGELASGLSKMLGGGGGGKSFFGQGYGGRVESLGMIRERAEGLLREAVGD